MAPEIIADLHTFQRAAAATGNGDNLDIRGWPSVSVQVTGTFSATVTFEITLNGSDWVAVEAHKASDGSKSSTATSAGVYTFPTFGAERARVRVSAYTSGSVTVEGRGTGANAPDTTDVELAASAVEIGTVDQGDPNAGGADSWPVQGQAADGAAVAGAPVRVAGKDGSGNTQDVVTDTDGHLQVDTLSEPAFTAPDSGEFAPGTSAAQFPTIACRYARMKARSANTGRVYIGTSGVTTADGVTDTNTGFELSQGEDTGWIPVDNLNRFYGIGNNATDSVTYLILV